MQGRILPGRQDLAGVWFAMVILSVAGAAAAQPRTAPPFTRLYREALERREKEYGPADPKTAESLTDLALFLQRSGDLASAEPLLRRTLAIQERTFGPQDVRVGAALLNLAELLQARNEPLAAEPLLVRALRLKEQAL